MRDRYQYIPFSELEMDEYSRLRPDPERFPSSVGGAGFKPLVDYVHSLGLKFGIHIMRGIPRIAAHHNGKIKNSPLGAEHVANPTVICGWNPDMYGVRNLPEGQLYYDSLLDTVEAKELWSGRQLTLNSGFSAALAPHACTVCRFETR